MSKVHDCQEQLLVTARANGFLTFDDIMVVSEEYDLSITEVDKLSEAIQLLGIIVYESNPFHEAEDAELDDYSRVDYDAVFNEIVQLDQSLAPLIEDVRKLPPPQYKEVATLSAQALDGNRYAKERLISIHLRLVLKIALAATKQYDLDIEDAIASGVTGLITAAERYDPNGFSAFQSYASMYVQQGIQRDCSPKWMDFYFPVHVRDLMIPILKEYRGHSCDRCPEDGICPALIEELSGKYGFPAERIQRILKYALIQTTGIYSIDQLQDAFSSETDFDMQETEESDFFSYESGIEESVEACSLREQFTKAFRCLTSREVEVLSMRFGLDNDAPQTLEQVGTEYGITRERVRQIEVKALRKLRHTKLSKLLVDYY